ncbi:MAG: hypothetical protein Q7S28_03370 [bacterium]|nr:hypothetical protein [bacterium]
MRTIVCGRWNKHSSRYPETKALWADRNLVDKGSLSRDGLAPSEDAVNELIVRTLASSGIDIIGDGGVGDDSVYDVARRIAGCNGFTQITRIPKTNHFHRQPVATLPLKRNQPLIVERLMRSRQYTSHPMIACLPGPYTTARQTANVAEIGLRPLALAYAKVLREEAQALLAVGAAFVRIEEPQIVDHPEDFELFAECISEFVAGISDANRVMLATWFGDVAAMPSFYNLPVGAFWLDFVEGRRTLETLKSFPDSKQLVAGIFDARHSYAESPEELSSLVQEIAKYVAPERLFIAPNTDLDFLPWDEASQKIRNISAWADTYRNSSAKPAFYRRVRVPSSVIRIPASTQPLPAPPLAFGNFPTSAVGSYPQSKELRSARVALRKGTLTEAEYRVLAESHTQRWMAFQNEIDMTVPVGGEFLREDMAVYFSVLFGGRTLDFVPSYENRRYRPVEYHAPIVRSGSGMLVNDFDTLQKLSTRSVKETITGPATLADWALLRHPTYYRDRRTFRRGLAHALRSEITDLVSAGVKILQVDEPALTTNMEHFLFDLEAIYETIAGFEKDIYLILHLCYSDMGSLRAAFPDILKLPFHQIHMEMANRDYALLKLIDSCGFGGKDIGLGVVDVHNDRVETVPEIVAGVSKTLQYFTPSQIWLTPDCGLKERSEAVSQAKLRAMCEAATFCRSHLS